MLSDIEIAQKAKMQKIVQNDAYDRIRYEQIIEKKNAPSIEQLQAKEDAIYQFIEDNHKSYSSDYYRYNQKGILFSISKKKELLTQKEDLENQINKILDKIKLENMLQ